MKKDKINRDLYKVQVNALKIMAGANVVLLSLFGIALYFYMHVELDLIYWLIVDILISFLAIVVVSVNYNLLRISYYIMMATHWICIVGVAINSGGTEGEFFYFFIILNAAAFVNGKREGFMWFALNSSVVISFFIATHAFDVTFSNSIPPESRQVFNHFCFGFIFLIITGISFLFSRSNHKAHRDKKLIAEQQEEIETQNDALQQKNDEIVSGITYASKIQNAMLPVPETIQKYFPEHFIIYSPKGIVSGDFYWVGEANGKKVIAAVDCTGHGVPGALMSMIGNSILNQTVLEKKITKASEILSSMRDLLIFTLGKRDKPNEQRDGMDMALLVFENDYSSVEYAGAKNPVYHIRNGELTVINGDAHPVGIGYGEDLKPFSSHTVSLEPGDQLYIFSDGFTDQFGGPLGRKFGYLQLQEKLLQNTKLSMEDQKAQLESAFEAWKGSYARIDDICMIGIRV